MTILVPRYRGTWTRSLAVAAMAAMLAPSPTTAAFEPQYFHEVRSQVEYWCINGESNPSSPVSGQPIGDWDVSRVGDFGLLFYNYGNMPNDCNPPIGNWDVSKATMMDSMFRNQEQFNQDLGKWNTYQVKDMSYMFNGGTGFNGNISTWNTGYVTTMNAMFGNAHSFNSTIDAWNTMGVTMMSNMFNTATAFNRNIGDWNVWKVTYMTGMFADATSFNIDISNWDTARVDSLIGSFSGSGEDGYLANFNFNYLAMWNTAGVKEGQDIPLGWVTPCPNNRPVNEDYMFGTVQTRCSGWTNQNFCPSVTCNSFPCKEYYDFVSNNDTYTCECDFTRTGQNCETPVFTYGHINNDDMDSCVAVLGANAGCGGLFICDTDNYLPCANKDGPVVNGSLLNLDFTTNSFQEFTIETGVNTGASYRQTEVPLTYVTAVTVPADEGFGHFTISSTKDVCVDGSGTRGTMLLYGSPDKTSAVTIPFLPRAQEGSYYTCNATIDGVLTRSQLEDTSNIWLVSLNADAQIQVGYNRPQPVIPKDDKVFYRYSLQGFTEEDYNQGTRFTFQVADIVHSDPDFESGSCTTLASLVNTIDSTANNGNGGCTLTLTPGSTPVNGITSLVYDMPRSKYAECAQDLNVQAGQVVFSGRLNLPSVGTGDCRYFQEQDSSRGYQIIMNRNLENDLDQSTSNALSSFSSNVLNVRIEQCSGSGMNYMTPKARLKFDLVVRYTGTVATHTLGTGTLTPGGDSVTFDNSSACDPVNKICTFYLESGECAPLYQHEDSVTMEEKCVFEDSRFMVYETFFKQTLESGLDSTHPLEVETLVHQLSFDRVACYKPTDTTIKDVTDDYAVSARARNHIPGGMEWTAATVYPLVWHDSIAIRLAVEDLPDITEVHIKTVHFTVTETVSSNPVGVPGGYTLTRDEKMRLMGTRVTPYYEGPHFCRYYDVWATGNNKCSAFYDSNESPFRWNTYMDRFSDPSALYHCTETLGGALEHNVDYVTFNLDRWVPTKPPNVQLQVDVKVTGTIEACLPATRRRDTNNGGTVEKIVEAEFQINVDPDASGSSNNVFNFALAGHTSVVRPLPAVVTAGAAALTAMMMNLVY